MTDRRQTASTLQAALYQKAVSFMRGGSRDVYDYGITGESYVADHRLYNAAGKLTEFATIASNGSEKATAYAAGVKLSGGLGNDIFYSLGGDSFVFKETFG